MPTKRSIDVRIAELEEKLLRLKLEKQIAGLQGEMRTLRPAKRATRRSPPPPARKRAVQPELLPAKKKKTAAKRKARAG